MTTIGVPEHRPLYEPSQWLQRHSVIADFLHWLSDERGLEFEDFSALHAWSVTEIEDFWTAIWEYFDVRATTLPEAVLRGTEMPDFHWFPGAELNYAEHCLRHDPASTAIIAISQTRDDIELSFDALSDQVRRVRAGLQRLGVGPGDRVVAYLPSIPETVVAFLATASLGAIWASCAPEFGSRAVLDRFDQLDPKVLLVVGGYRYGEKSIDRTAEVAAIRAGLPTVEHVVGVQYGPFAADGDLAWSDLLADTDAPLEYEPVAFEHPLYVLFSSGTTGKPKPIVHGHGGILLEHLKTLGLHWDLCAGDRLLWFSTTAWMMWNTLVSTLLHGAAAILLDGDPVHPSPDWQWGLAERTRATLMGASPGLIAASRQAGLHPARDHDLSEIRQIGVAGSPLTSEGFEWVHAQFGDDVLLNVGSGGTDVASAIVQGSPIQTVWDGEISSASLGVDAVAFDEQGRVVVGELGELVIRRPMPSMPVGFWGDTDRTRYREAYFDVYPGVWRHGDWVQFSEDGSAVITGRSDATLNRGGVRLGTAEFYRVVEELPEVAEGLVVHLEDADGGPGVLVLFVALTAGGRQVPVDELEGTIRRTLRESLTPRHVPDHILVVPEIPKTKTMKKLEVPVKRILQGADAADLASISSLDDPSVLDPFVEFGAQVRQDG